MKGSAVRGGKKTCRYLTLAESCGKEDGSPEAGPSPAFGEVWEMTTSDELEWIIQTLSARGARLGLSAESPRSCRATAARDSVFWRPLLNELFDILGARWALRVSKPSRHRERVRDTGRQERDRGHTEECGIALFAVTRRRRVVFLYRWFRANRCP